MGSFFDQYAYNQLNPPSRIKRLKHRYNKTKYHHKKKNFIKNQQISTMQKILNTNLIINKR
ncbi:unnamed protein product [Brassica oleracea]